MILPLAIAALSMGPDSLVSPVSTGGLSYAHTFESWTEVMAFRQKANLAGFGSISSIQDSGTYLVEFRIYGDSIAQNSQWRRLERLLNEPLAYEDRTPVYFLPIESVAVEVIEPVEPSMDLEAIAREDSLHAVRHMAISDEHRRIDLNPAGVPQSEENTLDLVSKQQEAETPILEPLQPQSLEEVLNPVQEASEPVAKVEQPSPAVQKDTPVHAPKTPAVRTSVQAQSSTESVIPAEKNTPAPRIPVEKAVNRQAKPTNSSGAFSEETQSDLAHPFQEGVTHVIVLGSFGNRDYAEKYQKKALEDHPTAKIWLVKGMYRVGIGYPYYPGNALKEVKADWPKAWVCPLP